MNYVLQLLDAELKKEKEAHRDALIGMRETKDALDRKAFIESAALAEQRIPQIRKAIIAVTLFNLSK